MRAKYKKFIVKFFSRGIVTSNLELYRLFLELRTIGISTEYFNLDTTDGTVEGTLYNIQKGNTTCLCKEKKTDIQIIKVYTPPSIATKEDILATISVFKKGMESAR